MHRFYHPDIERTQALPEEESKHCVRVLRLVEGDEIEVVDGRGNLYRCRIVMAHPSGAASRLWPPSTCRPTGGTR